MFELALLPFPSSPSYFPHWLISLFYGFGLFGTALGCLMFFGQIVLPNKNRLNYLLGTLFLGMSVLQGSSIAILSSSDPSFVWLILLHIPALYGVGPVLYGIYKSSTGESFLDSKQDGLLHSVFPVTGVLLYFVVLFGMENLSETIRRSFAEAVFPSPLDWILLPAVIGIGFYVFLVLKSSRDLWRWEVWKSEPTARILSFLVVMSLFHLTLGAFFFVTKIPDFLIFTSGGMGLALCAAYVIGHRYPGFFQKLQEVTQATREKYARSLLVGIDRATLKENLLHLMEKDFLYREEDLGLGDLADELALSTHQVSEFLNQELGKNFSVFVNDYRVSEACSLLTAEPDKSILDIAYSVGFRTKSSFNRAFQKHTGVTPSEYRSSKSG
ncbi:AraC family transcriptional regulator [Leptospira yasudae]|uniref:helix-turn-helix domain-containing protein n=1 Tax=Leptospira yasudae TaxID=2202201 RepID=UPI000E5A051A|nr:helix-turn-helix domain-containing protein [Leptospira yasudae]RHX93304.1 AraC family transcriptional regulator [Leptospira yasudae]